MDKLKEDLKAWASLVSLIVVGLGTTFAENEKVSLAIAVIGAIAGAIVVWATPNQDPLVAATKDLPMDEYALAYSNAVEKDDALPEVSLDTDSPQDEGGWMDPGTLAVGLFIGLIATAILFALGVF